MVDSQNHLITLLPRSDRLRLLSRCKRVELLHGEVLGEQGGITRSVYFPIDAFISLTFPLTAKPALEVAMVGREGMLGTHLALGLFAEPLHAVIQGTGSAWRIGTRAFRGEFAASAALRRVIHRYIYVQMAQFAASAACLRFHLIAPRLARWLLMTQDRANSNQFYVTQEFLSDMLGVQRVGVTSAAGILQREGLIKYSRGDVTVTNRAGLQRLSCSCYEADLRAYSHTLRSIRSSAPKTS